MVGTESLLQLCLAPPSRWDAASLSKTAGELCLRQQRSTGAAISAVHSIAAISAIRRSAAISADALAVLHCYSTALLTVYVAGANNNPLEREAAWTQRKRKQASQGVRHCRCKHRRITCSGKAKKRLTLMSETSVEDEERRY